MTTEKPLHPCPRCGGRTRIERRSWFKGRSVSGGLTAAPMSQSTWAVVCEDRLDHQWVADQLKNAYEEFCMEAGFDA